MSYESYVIARSRADDRPLRDLLPLDTPLSLMVDPSNACNFKCIFCPTGDPHLLAEAARPIGLMPYELFRKIIDDLAGFPRPLKVLHLYKDGEPLANKALPGMVAYAKSSGRAERVETTTNGSLLTEARARQLIEAGLDGIRISIYGLDDRTYRDVVRARTSFATIRSNVERLFTLKCQRGAALQVHCKILDSGLSAEEKNRFTAAFAPISDSVHIDSIMGWSTTPDRDMTLGLRPEFGTPGDPLNRARKVCSEPFMKLAVNFNGLVSVCCVDWALDTVVGDVRCEPLADIWNGSRIREFRLKHLAGRRNELRACASCQYVLGLSARTDIDAVADSLLGLYSEASVDRSGPAAPVPIEQAYGTE